MKLIAPSLVGILTCTLSWCQAPHAATPTSSGPTVKIRTGELRGSVTSEGVAVFKNVPFAQPPVGPLRWREPLPAKSWSGIRNATAFGPACVQTGHLNATSSEDCLQLNVWAPRWPITSPAPVMVWVHGGGNTAGSGVEPLFDGETFARHGIVLVTINYRLGVLGFFSHPELTRESPHHSSGNYGLLDQLMALQWVQANISRFGGDPENVTFFGESAGSMDINVLLSSPLSKGLFKRVITESGAVSAPQTLSGAEKRGEQLAAKLNIAGDHALAQLRALRTEDLLKATASGPTSAGPMLGMDVDGWVLPQSPMDVFASGKELPVGLMLGNNSQELQKPFFPMPEGLKETISKQYGPLADRALTLYGLGGPTEATPDPELGNAMAQWATDTQFRCGSVAEVIQHSAAGNPTYEYQFSRTVHGKEAEGAPHASEIPFVFGTLDVWQKMRNYNDSDRQYAATMQQYWVNYSKTGNPNGGTLPNWPRFDSADRAYLDFKDEGPTAKQALRKEVCNLYTQNQSRQHSPLP